MRHIFTMLLIAGFTQWAMASQYRLNETSIDALFEASTDISSIASMTAFPTGSEGAAVTKQGYLIRTFFCGWTGMHRKYIGTAGKRLGWIYVGLTVLTGCTGVAGVPLAVDFWGIIFSQSLWEKYQNNPKLMPWLGD